MKILQISSAQSLGGGERHLADLASGLVGRRHDVFVALRANSLLINELKYVPKENITTLPLRNSLDAPSARRLANLVRKHQIQIVHAHMARDYPLAAYAARRNSSSRLILTRHVLFPLNRLHRITFSKAARIIAVSQAVAAQLRADAVVPAKRICVILNGIDTVRFQDARRGFTRRLFLDRWKLPETALLIGTVGELTPLKGQEEFLRAAVQVLALHPNAYFIIAGVDHSRGNEHRTHIEQLIGELNLSGRVRLLGWVDDLADLYCALEVFVSASHTESFGLALAEAMASSTAVVATETEGARELIEHEDTGLLVPIRDVDKLASALSRLLEHEGERVNLGRAAQQAVSTRLNLARMIAETEEIYRIEIEANRRES